MELLIIFVMAQIFVAFYIDGDSEMTYAVKTGSSEVEGAGPTHELKHC